MTNDELARIHALRDALAQCQDLRVSFKGTARVRVLLNERGDVASAGASGLNDACVERCVERALAGVRFPNPSHPGPIELVVRFEVKEPDEPVP
jgi:hypothetical protein